MAILWERSLIPWVDETSREPYAGAKAYFFDAGTTTPIVTYNDASLAIPNDHPVVANSNGAFGPIFLPEQIIYHLRIETAAGVTLWDVDNISAPTTVVPDPPSGGTDTQYLMITGDIKMAWRTSAPTGYVRLNGRTIGQAASGATERANADCEALFLHLWTQDANLAVSGGRGGSAAGDWGAAKRIDLPDWRGRSPVGQDSMGAAAAGRVTDAQLGADSDLLGAAGGAAAHALITAELASHTHTGTTVSGGAHSHPVTIDTSDADTSEGGNRNITVSNDGVLQTAVTSTHIVIGSSGSAHTHTFTSDAAGSGTAHNNLQPSVVVPFFIKL